MIHDRSGALLAMFAIGGGTMHDAYCSFVARLTEAGKGTITDAAQAWEALESAGYGVIVGECDIFGSLNGAGDREQQAIG